MSIMDGGGRKRKMENEEESEEEKMEKFFALIRSTKEMLEHVNGEKKKSVNEDKAIRWNLSFQPQDFMGPDAQLNAINNVPRGSLLPGPSKKKKDEIKVAKDNFMVDTQLKTNQASMLPGPLQKKEEEEEEEKDKLAGDHGLDLDLKL